MEDGVEMAENGGVMSMRGDKERTGRGREDWLHRSQGVLRVTAGMGGGEGRSTDCGSDPIS